LYIKTYPYEIVVGKLGFHKLSVGR